MTLTSGTIRRAGQPVAFGLLFWSSAEQAAAAEVTLASLRSHLDLAWVLLCAGLVLMMQLGFLLLEAGMVRSKNSINVAQKNLLDLAFSVIVFALFGYMVAFGSSNGFVFGTDTALLALRGLTGWETAVFVFQVMFCGTAATIVSGAVAERMRLFCYVLCSVFVAGLVYPVFVHWAWGNTLVENTSAFLAGMGFVDFAGSTVVHSTGAWVALAACLFMGPRLGRFGADGSPVRIAGHNPVLAAAGALVLLVGWIGFNGGSTLAANTSVALIISNTLLAAATGGIVGYLLGWYRDGVVLPETAVSGMLGGLVAVTAGCLVLDGAGAMLVGAVGGFAALWGNDFLERECRIDDAVGAIGVHGFAGVAGTLALALVAPVGNLPLQSRWEQLQVQAAGVSLNFIWAFGLSCLFFWLLSKFSRLRVSGAEEVMGLNETEHGTRMGVGHVERALDKLVDGTADLSMRLAPTPGDESEELTRLFNHLMDNIQSEEIERGRAAMVLRDAQEAERLSALANATFEAIWILQDGRIIDGNDKLEQLLGEPISNLKGRMVAEFIAPDFSEAVAAAMLQEVAQPYEARVRGPDGNEIPVELRGREISYRGVRSRVGCLVDLRERKSSEARIRHLALHDPLTGVPNRVLFNERLHEIVERREEVFGKSALLLVDLDRFKDINDMYGHPAGDRVIQVSAERLIEIAGSDCTVARLGGDEFAVLMTGLAFPAQAEDIAFRITNGLAQPIELADGSVVRTGASIGVAVSPDHGTDQAKLISRADTALYEAKNMGRNTHCMYQSGMDDLLENRRLLEADLALATERGEFELHFQPRVSLNEGRIVSYEALIRWRHSVRGLVGPSDFIPVAEQSGSIIQIGAWVLRTACVMARDQLEGARVSVNVSPVQFRQKNFVDVVRAAILDSGVHPGLVEIEITEGVLIDDDKRAHRILTELKTLGITIALDDFGTGYSSLSYLSRFPFDTIKIDRSFVSQMTESDTSLAIINTIAGLGNGLKMTVVAEGVETTEQARLLAVSGCHELQGYLLGRPRPVSRLTHPSDSSILSVIEAAKADPGEDAAALARTAMKMRSRVHVRKTG